MTQDIIEQVEELLVTTLADSADPYVRGKHRECDCPLPLLKKAYNDYLGVAVVIRFCCALKALQELTGLSNIYEVNEYRPLTEWQGDEIIEDQKTGKLRRRGEPPPWLKDRLERKGLSYRT